MASTTNDNTLQKSTGLTTSFRKAATIAFESALSEIEKNWDGALSGKDTDAVHDLRVGTRRLRAALSIYEAVLPERELRRIERNVSTLTDALGPARDADVLLEHLKSVADRFAKDDEAEAVGVKSMIDDVRKTRDREQAILDKTLKSFNISQLRSDLRPTEAKANNSAK
jgi:CHAD domain-containing protein